MRKSFSNLLKIRVLLIFLSANIERLFKKICFRLQLEWVRWPFVMTWFSGAGLSAWKSVQPHQYQRNTTITSSSLRDPHHYQNNIHIKTTSEHFQNNITIKTLSEHYPEQHHLNNITIRTISLSEQHHYQNSIRTTPQYADILVGRLAVPCSKTWSPVSHPNCQVYSLIVWKIMDSLLFEIYP